MAQSDRSDGSDRIERYQQATVHTASRLYDMATTIHAQQLSQLTLPEIRRITDEIAQVVPAGNVPGLILSGLSRLKGRVVAVDDSRRHLDLLLQGVQRTLDAAVYSAFFAGPAAVLYGYQQLLRLAGKEVDAAFPQGTWQYYLEMALRDDSARHANETTGFQEFVQAQAASLSAADELACWLLAVTHFVANLDAYLTNEWRERVVLCLLADVAQAHFNNDGYRNLHRKWEQMRPYQWDRRYRDFAYQRRSVFDDFWQPHYEMLPQSVRVDFDARLDKASRNALSQFQQQMTWLAYLEPHKYREERIVYPLDEAYIAVISGGHYYLLPFDELLADNADVRRLAIAIVNDTPSHAVPTLDDQLVRIARDAQHAARRSLTEVTRQALERLRRAPVIINWDMRPHDVPLGRIRQGKRGLGDHALTIFRTAESMVFDQSHIFFDGAWGAAVAEILTNQAVHRAGQLPQQERVYAARRTIDQPRLIGSVAGYPQVRQGTSAETTAVDLSAMLMLRKLLKQRNDLVALTVNDFFVLYRTLHARAYQPSAALLDAIDHLLDAERQPVLDAIVQLKGRNPSLLIPIDASQYDPRERVFPTTFRNPLTDFGRLHRQLTTACNAYQAADGREARRKYDEFDMMRAEYLGLLSGFGVILQRYKEIALRGESTSTASIKFLAHVPAALQQMLNAIPGRFDVLNDVIKGEEVISNLGRVADGSSLRRFITAKDDNENKTLAWGILTDDSGTLHLSLRDFRPHVGRLLNAGQDDLAQQITQDYLDAYARGLNQYVEDVIMIARARKPERGGFLSWFS